MQAFNGLQEKTYSSDEEENRYLKKELTELKKELKVKTALCETWKQQQDDYFELKREEQQVAKEMEIVCKELLHYKQECLVLRKKSKDLELTLKRTEKDLQEKIHVLEMEVEKLQKETSVLKNNALTSRYHREELAQKDKELLNEKKRFCDLEKQIEQMSEEKESSQLPKVVIKVRKVSKGQADKAIKRNMHLSNNLTTSKQQLVKGKQDLEKKDHIIEEKEKEYEELKQSTSHLPPPEKVKDIFECKWTIRDQRKKIRALSGAMNMYQTKAKEYKTENENLGYKAQSIKKLYLNEEIKSEDLRKGRKKSGLKQPREDKTDVPLSCDDTPLKKQDPTKITNTVRLPPICNTFQLQSEAKTVPTWSKKLAFLSAEKSNQTQANKRKQYKPEAESVPTRPKKIVYLSEEKSDQTTTIKNIHSKSKGKTGDIIFPNISTKTKTTPKKSGKI